MAAADKFGTDRPFVAHSAQGFLKRRRREAGILTQLVSVYKLKRCGRSGLLLNTDEANAFCSTKREVLSDVATKIFVEGPPQKLSLNCTATLHRDHGIAVPQSGLANANDNCTTGKQFFGLP